MREIKFRVYNKEKKKFVYYTTEDLYFMVVDDKIFSGLYNKDIFEKEQQYTGLSDKQGKEIYEGDIIQYDESGYTNKEKKKVEFRGSSFMCGCQCLNEMQLHLLWVVVGNIHANPELLGVD